MVIMYVERLNYMRSLICKSAITAFVREPVAHRMGGTDYMRSW